MKFLKHITFILLFVVSIPALGQENLIESILSKGSKTVTGLLSDYKKYRIAIRYTKIDRQMGGGVKLTEYAFGVNDSEYFYPASMVKFPAALIAAEKAGKLNIPLSAPMFTDSIYSGQTKVKQDKSAQNGLPSLGHYMKKIFLVSDNDAYNRLYEFIGRASLNETLKEKGFTGTNLITRLSVAVSAEENKHTNPVRFVLGKKEKSLAGEYDPLIRENTCAVLFQGKGYYRGDSLINSPFSLHRKNRFTLLDMHRMLKVFIFPENYPEKTRFKINQEDREFILRSMATLPRESDYPAYKPYNEYYDGYVKYFMYGNGKDSIPSSVRIFNKVGQAYGYLIDNAYITDEKNGVELFLSAVMYVNEDGIFNDDKYEYESVGYPFLAEAGKLFYEYELSRHKAVKADLSPLFKLFKK